MKTEREMAASASLLKSSPVLDKSEFLKGQALRQPSAVSVVRCQPVSSATLTVRASSYADELVKTAVRGTSPLVYCWLAVITCIKVSMIQWSRGANSM